MKILEDARLILRWAAVKGSPEWCTVALRNLGPAVQIAAQGQQVQIDIKTSPCTHNLPFKVMQVRLCNNVRSPAGYNQVMPANCCTQHVASFICACSTCLYLTAKQQHLQHWRCH